jgi:hypothetical protein
MNHLQRNSQCQLSKYVEGQVEPSGMDKHVGQVPPDLRSPGRVEDQAGTGGLVQTGLLQAEAVVGEGGHLQQRDCEHEYWRGGTGILKGKSRNKL